MATGPAVRYDEATKRVFIGYFQPDPNDMRVSEAWLTIRKTPAGLDEVSLYGSVFSGDAISPKTIRNSYSVQLVQGISPATDWLESAKKMWHEKFGDFQYGEGRRAIEGSTLMRMGYKAITSSNNFKNAQSAFQPFQASEFTASAIPQFSSPTVRKRFGVPSPTFKKEGSSDTLPENTSTYEQHPISHKRPKISQAGNPNLEPLGRRSSNLVTASNSAHSLGDSNASHHFGHFRTPALPIGMPSSQTHAPHVTAPPPKSKGPSPGPFHKCVRNDPFLSAHDRDMILQLDHVRSQHEAHVETVQANVEAMRANAETMQANVEVMRANMKL